MIINSQAPLPTLDSYDLQRRNFEERVGRNAFMGTVIEEFWIDKYKSLSGVKLKDILDDLKVKLKDLDDENLSESAMHSRLLSIAEDVGKDIFTRGVEIVQTKFDDRPIYWARIKARAIIRSHVIWKKFTDLALLNFVLDRLEWHSRNLGNMDFSTAPSGHKHYILTGFDPYMGLKDAQIISDLGYSSNTSGIIALYFHGKTLTNGSESCLIQSCIVPTRYNEFDGEIIEEALTPFLTPLASTEVDMIMSISLDPNLPNSNNPSHNFYGKYINVVERFAGVNRWIHYPDANNQLPRESKSKVLDTSEGNRIWLQTTLPKALISLPASYAGLDISTLNRETVEVMLPNRYRSFGDYIPMSRGKWTLSVTSKEPIDKFEDPSSPVSLETITPIGGSSRSVPVTISPLNLGDDIHTGSGGAYLSNEIYYRIALMRERLGSSASTGHIHVPIVTLPIWDAGIKPKKTSVRNNPKRINGTDLDIILYLQDYEDNLKKCLLATIPSQFFDTSYP